MIEFGVLRLELHETSCHDTCFDPAMNLVRWLKSLKIQQNFTLLQVKYMKTEFAVVNLVCRVSRLAAMARVLTLLKGLIRWLNLTEILNRI